MSFALVELENILYIFFVTALRLQICQRKEIENLTPLEKFTCSTLVPKEIKNPTNKETKNRLKISLMFKEVHFLLYFRVVSTDLRK